MSESAASAVLQSGQGRRVGATMIAFLALGLAALYVPTLFDWFFGRNRSYSQGHEPIVLAVCAWTMYRDRAAIARLPFAASRGGAVLLSFGLVLYLMGRVFGTLWLELLSLLAVVAGILVHFKGFAALRLTWFAFAFFFFAFPLPYQFVFAVTGPLKTGVSAAATQLMDWFGYPVGRSGVVITVGPYQLLVAEACAGLQTMFSLEAMGLLYASLMPRHSALRKGLLAALVVPISFTANVIRVVILALVTLYLGDAAGQGFLHGFAGMVLFVVALVLIIAVDGVLGRLMRRVEAR